MPRFVIETFAGPDDPNDVWIGRWPSLEAAKQDTRRIFHEEGWPLVVLWDSPHSGASRLLTCSRES